MVVYSVFSPKGKLGNSIYNCDILLSVPCTYDYKLAPSDTFVIEARMGSDKKYYRMLAPPVTQTYQSQAKISVPANGSDWLNN